MVTDESIRCINSGAEQSAIINKKRPRPTEVDSSDSFSIANSATF
jgi:hypothetical protein